MFLLLLSFSDIFTNNVALLNIVFLYSFGLMTGGFLAVLYYDYFLDTEFDLFSETKEKLIEQYEQKDQERLAYIHKLQISKDELQIEYTKLKTECADNLGLTEQEEMMIGVGGTD